MVAEKKALIVVADKDISFFPNVACKIDGKVVDRDSDGLHFVPADPRRGNKEYYHRGVFIWKVGEKNIFLNKHYFGVTPEELGRKLTFDVSIREKTFSDGSAYTYVDLHKTDDKPDFDFKLNLDHPESGGDIQIAGTTAFIRIIPRKKLFRAVEAVADHAEHENSLQAVFG
jgi:hypothetical protein